VNIDVNIRDLMAGIAGDATMRDLFGATEDSIKALKQRRDLEEARRMPVAMAVARVLASDDGKVMFQAMLDMTFRGHVDVVGMGLPSDVALQQLIAENARKEFVVQLIKLAREATAE
jgi:hypothetical protein